MNKLVRRIAFLAVLAFTAGCDAVVMENRIGDTIDRGEALRLNGVWMTDQGPIHAEYNGDGKLVFASLRWDEAHGEFKQEGGTAYLTQAGKDKFMALPHVGSPNPEDSQEVSAEGSRFICFRYELKDSGGSLYQWPASLEAFETAINDGKLAGSVRKEGRNKTVRITASSEELTKFVQAEGAEKLFPSKESEPFAKRVRLPHR